MQASVVYDGVDGVAGAVKGSLFRGVKFWIAQRVPQRSSWVQNVKNNGGEVVPLEKQADILIADHARKDAPAGSCSWRFIEESIKNGRLEDKDDHLIGGPEPSSRPVGSYAPSKGTRTKFTPADDALLAAWVLNSEKKGHQTKGNTIYMDFAVKYPHHTWQSWRDHWVKKVSLLPRDALTRLVEGQPSPPTPPPPAPRSRITETPAGGRASTQANETKGRVFFTEEDDKILVERVNEAIEAAERVGRRANIKGNKIYQEIEEEHPHHTYHSWRDRYLRHLSQRDENSTDETADDTKQTPRASRASVPASHAGSAVPQPVSRITQSPPSAVAPPASVDRKDFAQRLEKQELNRKRGVAAKTIQRVWRGHKARRDLRDSNDDITEMQALAQGFIVRRAVGPALVDNYHLEEDHENEMMDEEMEGADRGLDGVDGGQIEIKNERGSTDSEEDDHTPHGSPSPLYGSKEFHTDLNEYRRAGHDVDLWPKVHGRQIDLWKLFQAVTQEIDHPEHRDWEKVAETLGFDWIRLPDVPERIREIYEANLADFERALLDFDTLDPEEDEEDDSEGEEEPISDIVLPDAGSVRLPRQHNQSLSPFSSSPPPVAGIKRSAQEALHPLNGNFRSDSSSKRARYSRDSEIPSTPDEKIGMARRDQRSASRITDSGQRGSMGRKPAGSIETTPARKHLLKRLQKPVAIEPETQDFGYGLAVEEDALAESQYDVTPSQQLRTEEEAVTPIPLAFGKRSSERPAPSRTVEDEGASSRSPRASAVNNFGLAVSRRPTRAVPIQGPRKAEDVTERTAKRRSLPSSFGKVKDSAALPPSQATPRATSANPALQPSSHDHVSPISSTAPSPPRALAPRAAPFMPREKPAPPPLAKEGSTVTEVVEHYMSMGYPRNIVIKSLRATTMREGYPMSEVLESLMKGEGIPTSISRVWTTKDDDGLRLVYDFERTVAKGKKRAGAEGDADKRLRKKADRERARLEAKHGKKELPHRWEWLVKVGEDKTPS